MIADSIKTCQFCKQVKKIPTVPGVHYASQNNEKTHCLNTKQFIGVDTGWLITVSNFKTIIDPFLKIGIPIITNHYHLSQKAGEKCIGVFNKSHIRNDNHNHSLTSYREILAASDTMQDDLYIMYRNGFIADYLVQMIKANFFIQLHKKQGIV